MNSMLNAGTQAGRNYHEAPSAHTMQQRQALVKIEELKRPQLFFHATPLLQ